MNRVSAWMSRLIGGGIVAHLVLTAFENSPDAKVSFGTRGDLLGRLPQWRFFAPTPGIDNTHLMFRSRAALNVDWGEWAELPLVQPISWLALVWNPGTRAPKALFDCAQHLRMMGNVGSKWSAVIASPAYLTVARAVRVATRDRHHVEAQFMVVASRNGGKQSMLQPLLVSDPISVDGV